MFLSGGAPSAAFVGSASLGSRTNILTTTGPCLPKCRGAHRLPRSVNRRVRMSVPFPADDQPPEKPDPVNSFNMEILRRRMTHLNERQKAGHKPTDQVLDLSVLHGDEEELEDSDAEQFVREFEELGTVWVIVFTSTKDGSEGVYSLNVAQENIVLAFQDKEEAQRYSLCLEAQEFPSPQICELETGELCEFCSESGFRLGFVPTGSLISPPEETAVEDLDQWRGKPSGSGHAGTTGMSDEDIDTMKKRLDSLFGK